MKSIKVLIYRSKQEINTIIATLLISLTGKSTEANPGQRLANHMKSCTSTKLRKRSAPVTQKKLCWGYGRDHSWYGHKQKKVVCHYWHKPGVAENANSKFAQWKDRHHNSKVNMEAEDEEAEATPIASTKII